MADATHPSVTRDDLRQALTPRGAKRPATWSWDAELGASERLELAEMRQVVDEQRKHLDELTEAAQAAKAREHELREALSRLAAAGVFGRRKVLAELREAGIL